MQEDLFQRYFSLFTLVHKSKCKVFLFFFISYGTHALLEMNILFEIHKQGPCNMQLRGIFIC